MDHFEMNELDERQLELVAGGDDGGSDGGSDGGDDPDPCGGIVGDPGQCYVDEQGW
jgi:hypothetical protein